MFKLCLDIELIFVPPMEEMRAGICLTREFELPFVPTCGMHLTGMALNDSPVAMGFRLEDVTWDVDREG